MNNNISHSDILQIPENIKFILLTALNTLGMQENTSRVGHLTVTYLSWKGYQRQWNPPLEFEKKQSKNLESTKMMNGTVTVERSLLDLPKHYETGHQTGRNRTWQMPQNVLEKIRPDLSLSGHQDTD